MNIWYTAQPWSTTARLLRFWPWLLLLLLFVCNSSNADDSRPPEAEPSPFQSLLDEAVAEGLPGASLVVQGPEVDFVGGAGVANMDTKEVLTPDHLMYLASIGKTFLATVAVQLAHEGRLNLDNPITTWLPGEITERIPSSDQITLQQLLNHTSGVFDYLNEGTEWFEDFMADPQRQWSHAEVVPYIFDKPLHFPPGTDYRYSNSNYILAALIIEQVTGQPHYLSIRSRILEPLGLSNTYNGEETEGITNLVHGYVEVDEELMDFYPWYSHMGLADAGMHSTPSDLAFFLRALFTGDQILNDAMRQEMITVSELGQPPSIYGLGIVVFADYEGLGPLYYHDGRVPGYGAAMLYFPELDLTVTLCANGSSGDAYEIYEGLLEGVVELALGEDDDEAPETFSAQSAAEELQQVIDLALAQEDILNAVLRVDAPDQDFSWKGAGGLADPATGEVMTTEHAFRIASTTKPMTATIILQLIEEGYFSLDTTLGELFGPQDLPDGYTVADLHVIDGVKRGDEITVRQLLNHSTGMKDYIFDSADGGNFSEGSLFYAILTDVISEDGSGISTHQWSPEELLTAYLELGLAENALFKPGQRHYYSDTNYLLLGMLIEKVTGMALADQYRLRIFAPLGMTHTYLEWYEPSLSDPLAHHFFNLEELGVGNVDLVAVGLNTSTDWAGGGLVSTVKDLNTFLQALVEGELFQEDATLEMMTEWISAGASTFYGLGLGKENLAGQIVWGHSGFWGSAMIYLPDKNLTVSLAINQVVANPTEYLEAAVKALLQAGL